MRERPPVCSECHNGVESVARLFFRSHIMCCEQYQSKEKRKTRDDDDDEEAEEEEEEEEGEKGKSK